MLKEAMICIVLWNVGASPVFGVGLRINPELVEAEYRLRPIAGADLISEFIVTQQPNLDDALDPGALAAEIVGVSQCFGIDPYVLAGLAWVESSFRLNAESSTGAAGLTQFTQLGIKEVHIQLGHKGEGDASPQVIAYFNRVVEGCVSTVVVGEKWRPIWRKTRSPERYKDYLKKESASALIYCAVLLKSYLATTARHRKSLKSIYFYALAKYNGEAGNHKYDYATKVLEAADFASRKVKSAYALNLAHAPGKTSDHCHDPKTFETGFDLFCYKEHLVTAH